MMIVMMVMVMMMGKKKVGNINMMMVNGAKNISVLRGQKYGLEHQLEVVGE